MLEIAIIDDEKVFVDILHNKVSALLSDMNADYRITTFVESEKLLQASSHQQFDLLFLDIDMPNITGMDIAHRIRLKNMNTEVIFVTNKEELVYDTIKYGPFRFIRKSRLELEIEEALRNYLKKSGQKNVTRFFSTDNGKTSVKVIDIVYVEVQSHKLTIHLNDKTIYANGNLNDIESDIEKYGFIRIHKSYLVNFRYIEFIHQKEVILDDGNALPLSRRKLDFVQKELMRFTREL